MANDRFMLPLVKLVNCYSVPDDMDAADWITSESNDDLTRYIQRHHIVSHEKIEIYGTIYLAQIFVAEDPDDYSYVCVDQNLVPTEAAQEEDIESEFVRYYAETVVQVLCSSEGMVPDQRTYLESQYIKPIFIERDPADSSKTKIVTWERLGAYPSCVICGEPGAGKTSFMRKLALELARACVSQHTMTGHIPVYIQLRDWRANTSLASQISNLLLTSGGDWIAERAELLKEQGRLTLLLDGLDEVLPKFRESILRSVQKFNEAHPRCHIFLSTRPIAYNRELKNFSVLEISNFDEGQIREFSYRRLFGKKSWKRFVSCLSATQDILDLVRNPLLLSIALFLYWRKAIVPQNRAQLIKSFVDALVEEWDSARGVTRDAGELLSSIRTRNYLSRISFHCKAKGTTVFSALDIRYCFDSDSQLSEVECLLERIGELTGLIVRSEPDTWSFTHSAFIDFLTAAHLVERTQGLDAIYRKYSSNTQWNEVWQNVGGLSSDPEYILKLLTTRDHGDATSGAKDALNLILQSLVLDRQQVEENSVGARRCLEELLRDFEVSQADQSETKLPAGTQWIWCIRGRGGHMDFARAKAAVELIRLLYDCRSTIYGSEVTAQMNRSASTVVKCLANIFVIDGRIDWQIAKRGFFLYVVPESPEVRHE